MRGRLRTTLWTTAALAAAVALYVALTLPPPAIRLDGVVPPTHVAGAWHVHTLRSDGTGSVDDVAAAAARAGLRYVVLTDHGSGVRSPEPPTYRHGVLVVDAVEISSRDGHVIALGLNAPAPYPLAGAARDVVEDVKRLGGFTIVAHPDSPKADLRWRAMNVPYDGLEWINVDSEWRDESTSRLLGGALRSMVRPAAVIADLFSRPVATMRRWDQASRGRAVFGVAALDAHARIGWREDEEPRQRTALARPSYDSLFGSVQQVAVLDAPLGADAVADGARLVSALSSGRSYSIVAAHAAPAVLEFSAVRGAEPIAMGRRVVETGEPVTLRASIAGAPGVRVALLRDGQQVESGQGSVSTAATGPGVYRVEAYLPGRDVPWIVSNPISIAASQPVGGPAGQPDTTGADTRTMGPRDGVWAVEHDPLSATRRTVDGVRTAFDFALGNGPAFGQFAALVVGGHDEGGVERVSFTASASRPMRVSVQIRLRSTGSDRWRHSAYIDQVPRSFTLRLRDFDPADEPTSRRPNYAPIHSLLFVVDTLNTLPGTKGTVWISELALGVNRIPDGG